MKFSGKFWIERIILVCAVASMIREVDKPGGELSAIFSIIFVIVIFVGLPYLMLREEKAVVE